MESQIGDSEPFNAILVDTVTDEQVGVWPGWSLFKVDLLAGGSGFEFGPVNPLPVINTQVTVTTHWLDRLFAWYTCDGVLIGWESEWHPDGSSATHLERESSTVQTSNIFGSLPNGDVVTADVTSNHSVVWNGAYTNVLLLDPDADPTTTLIDGQCALAMEVELALETPSDPSLSPFNMTAATTIFDLANNAQGSADPGGPFLVVPRLHFTSALVNGDPNPGNPIVDALAANCLALVGASPPQECSRQVESGPDIMQGFIQAPELKSASYTTTTGVSEIVTTGNVPGNRGEPRVFDRAWR